MIKSALVALLISGFMGIAVFGALAMDHNHSHGGCIAASAKGADCPDETFSPLGAVVFHIGAFKDFSLALLVKLLIGIISAAAVAIFLSSNNTRWKIAKGAIEYLARRRLSEILTENQRRLISWLAFHELSPSFSLDART